MAAISPTFSLASCESAARPCIIRGRSEVMPWIVQGGDLGEIRRLLPPSANPSTNVRTEEMVDYGARTEDCSGGIPGSTGRGKKETWSFRGNTHVRAGLSVRTVR